MGASRGALAEQPLAPGARPGGDVIRPSAAVKLLAYVHMRNIHASTGAGRVARQLVEHLALRSDVQLRVLADAADHARILPLLSAPWPSLQYHLFSRDTSSQQSRWVLLNRPRAEAFWPQAQVVFCTAESYVPVKDARLVVTLHDAAYFEPDAHRRDLSFLKQQWKWRLLFQKLARRADLFHTVSEFSAERLSHYFPAIKARLRVVPNAVAPHFLEPVSAAGSAYLQQAGLAERPFLLVPGGLHFRKNAELTLAACPRLQQLFPELVIAVVNHSSETYVRRAQALGPQLRLLGFVSEAALHALYSAAQVVWFPSRYEGFGMPVLEAMACGAPVVASRASAIPEITGSAALLADPFALSAHVDALASLLTDARAREQPQAAGRARAAQFSWTSSADQLKKHIDTLL